MYLTTEQLKYLHDNIDLMFSASKESEAIGKESSHKAEAKSAQHPKASRDEALSNVQKAIVEHQQSFKWDEDARESVDQHIEQQLATYKDIPGFDSIEISQKIQTIYDTMDSNTFISEDYSINALSEDGSEAQKQMLDRFENVTTLTLRLINYPKSQLESLVNGLKRSKQLTRVYFTTIQFANPSFYNNEENEGQWDPDQDMDWFIPILDVIKEHKNLEEIIINNCRVSMATHKHISKTLKDGLPLKKLTISNCGFYKEAELEYAEALEINPYLVSFTYNNFGQDESQLASSSEFFTAQNQSRLKYGPTDKSLITSKHRSLVNMIVAPLVDFARSEGLDSSLVLQTREQINLLKYSLHRFMLGSQMFSFQFFSQNFSE